MRRGFSSLTFLSRYGTAPHPSGALGTRRLGRSFATLTSLSPSEPNLRLPSVAYGVNEWREKATDMKNDVRREHGEVGRRQGAE